MISRRLVFGAFGAALIVSAGIGGLVALSGRAPAADAPTPQMRRMTQGQYRNTIADVFSPEIKVVGQFEPEVRLDGLGAVGSSRASISASGYERYHALARRVAAQVVSDEYWAEVMPCDTADRARFDKACTDEIVNRFGEALFRREVTQADREAWGRAARLAMEEVEDFRAAMGLVIEGMLASPEFLFLVDTVEEDGNGRLRLTAHAKASRLSYLLWNTTPDAELWQAAREGDLHTRDGLTAQVDRMLASDRLAEGVAAFFGDFLHLGAFETIEKDKLIYPAFNEQVAEDAREQLLRFLDYQLLDQDAPYKSIFTARETFVTRALGPIYAVPVRSASEWERVRFADDDLRGGLLSHVAFTALHAHPGRSSATLRGIAVRELLLCQTVAPAPAAVNFTVVQDTNNPDFKTARARLTQHRTDPACSSCHEFIDPIGLAMENFDGAGSFRATENGESIDASGSIDGFEYSNARELEGVLAEHPATAACLVDKARSYATGRPAGAFDAGWTARLEKRFERTGQRLRPLLREIATSPEFYAVTEPEDEEAADRLARQDPGTPRRDL